MSAPLNVLLFGKIPTHLKAVPEALQPEFIVIQTASSVDDAQKVLPPLVSDSGDKKIDLIIMGGNFSDAEHEEIGAIQGAKSVPWFRPDPEKIKAGGGKPPTAEDVAQRAKKAISEHAANIREGKGAGELYYY